MAEVKIEQHVIAALNELIEILYKKEYFGFVDSAIDYAAAIYDFIYRIPQQRYKATENTRYGNYYASYKANQRTTWFICFDIKGDQFIISHITNNHSPDYPYFIAS
jgi:hypothetical protein